MGEKKKKKGKRGDKNTVVTFADQYDDDELLRPFKSGVPPLDELPKKSNLREKHSSSKGLCYCFWRSLKTYWVYW